MNKPKFTYTPEQLEYFRHCGRLGGEMNVRSRQMPEKKVELSLAETIDLIASLTAASLSMASIGDLESARDYNDRATVLMCRYNLCHGRSPITPERIQKMQDGRKKVNKSATNQQ